MASSRKTKVIALSLGQALARMIGLVVTVVMARVLVKEDLAAYRQTFLAYATLSPILALGVGQGMFYFLPVEKDRIRGRVMDGIFVAGIMGMLFSVFLALGGNQLLAQRFSNPKVANMLLWMVPYALISTPSQFSASVLVARDYVKTEAIFGVLKQLVIGVATVIPLILWQTAEASLIGNVAASVLMGGASLTLMIRSTPNDSFAPNLASSKELVSFAFPLALASMIGTISLQLDKIIVSVMCSPEDFAIYSIGAFQLPLIGIITGSLTAVTIAEMRKSIADEKPDEAVQLFRNVAIKSSYLIIPIMVFLLLMADHVIVYLFSDSYRESAKPFRIYLLLLPIRTVVFGSLMTAMGMSRLILLRAAIGICLNVGLSIICVRQFGPWGAVIATVITVYLWAVPFSVSVLCKPLKRKWFEIFPVFEMITVFAAILPVAGVALVIILLIDQKDLEFILVTLSFVLYLFFYWNGRIYSISAAKDRIYGTQPPNSN